MEHVWKKISYDFCTVLGTSNEIVEVLDTEDGVFFRPGEEQRLERLQAERYVLLFIEGKVVPSDLEIKHLKRVFGKKELVMEQVSENLGMFVASLKRNNKQIRDDRAKAIAEDTEVLYKRKVEDLELSIRKMMREQENMLDLSPTNAQSLVLASDFNSAEYVDKDIELGLKIRNAEIKLEIARNRYNVLFGGK